MWARVLFLLAFVPACRARAESYYDSDGDSEDADDSYNRYNDEFKTPVAIPTAMEGLTRLKRWELEDFKTLNHEPVVDVKGVQDNLLQGDDQDPLRGTRNPQQHTDSYVYVENGIRNRAEDTTVQRRFQQRPTLELAKSSGDGRQVNTIKETLSDPDSEQHWSFVYQTETNDILAEVRNQQPIRGVDEPTRSSSDVPTTSAGTTEETEDPNVNYPLESTTYNPSDMQVEVRKLVQHWSPASADMNPQETTTFNPSEEQAEVRKLVQHWSPSSKDSMKLQETTTFNPSEEQAEVRKLVQHWSPSSKDSSTQTQPQTETEVEVTQESTTPEEKDQLLLTRTSLLFNTSDPDETHPRHPRPFSLPQSHSSSGNVILVSRTMDFQHWKALEADEENQALISLDDNDLPSNVSISIMRQQESYQPGRSGDSSSQSDESSTTTTESTTATTTNTNEPTSTTNTNDPTSTTNTNDPTSTTNTNDPTSTTNTNDPTSTTNTNDPTSTTNTNDPTSTTNTNDPTSTTTTSTTMEPPTTTTTTNKTTTKKKTTTTTTTTTTKPTTTTRQVDIDAIMAIISNLTYDYEWNLTEQFNKSVIDHGIPTCPGKNAEDRYGPRGIWTATVNGTTVPYEFVNASVVSKCFVCGLKDTDIPRDAHCSDAFAADFLPLMPIDAQSRGKVAGFRKYCRYTDVQNYMENPLEPRAIYGRFTGGCAVRWTDVTGVFTQRTCRAKFRPLLGKHFASKRMAKLEMALVNVENGCIISPMATLLPVSRGISLYARFHACVCNSNWCNRATVIKFSTSIIMAMALAHWLVHTWSS